MNIPGFNAEWSLSHTRGRYTMAVANTQYSEAVHPAGVITVFQAMTQGGIGFTCVCDQVRPHRQECACWTDDGTPFDVSRTN
jgi:hypothetical protein